MKGLHTVRTEGVNGSVDVFEANGDFVAIYDYDGVPGMFCLCALDGDESGDPVFLAPEKRLLTYFVSGAGR